MKALETLSKWVKLNVILACMCGKMYLAPVLLTTKVIIMFKVSVYS